MAEDVTNEKTTEEGFSLAKLGMGAWIGIAVAALVVGLIIGKFAMGGGGAGAALNKAALNESEIDSQAIAQYTYNGKTTQITAHEVLEQNGLLESSKDEEGNYSVPSSETIISFARNQIISSAADEKGIEVSDEDLAAYAEEMLGSSDFASISSSYNMDEETVKNVLRNSAKMNKLREQVIGDEEAGEAPEAPTPPEVKTEENAEGEEGQSQEEAQEAANSEKKKEYADYIIKLAGDEWDAEKGAFKSEDGKYATALADSEVTKDGADYNAAQAAYYVAYQDYSTKQSEITEKWTDYVNELLGNASISVYTLKS